MFKRSVAVLEIGSKNVTCVIAQRGVNGTFIIKSVAEKKYDGFDGGKFFSKKSVSEAIMSVISETSKNVRMRISDLYVGVPGEFSTVRTQNHTLAFNRKKRIGEKEIRELYNWFTLDKSSDYVITDVSAIYFELDDSRRVLHPQGAKTYKLTGYLSYMLCTKEFQHIVGNTCRTVGVKNIHYISESLAECDYLLNEQQKEYPRVLIDCGYLTTNVCVAYGGGVLFQKAFSYGGGYITASLIDAFDIGLDFAEKLKRTINLGFDVKSTQKYTVTLNDDFIVVPIEKANLTARACLDELAGQISNLLTEWHIECDRNVPAALTGGGISYMRGAKELLASRLDSGIFIVVPPVPAMNLPDKSACLSLLDRALGIEEGRI
ncbi:MAG: hypothetical protein SO373_06615 [Candidatus Borkfalkiaceae bacterium]|nr:hypothetical protein [Christensenellaceae bacterium]